MSLGVDVDRDRGRYLCLRAGPFRVALPLLSVRQILDVGGQDAQAPSDPRALGVHPVPLGEVLGVPTETQSPALLLFDGSQGPVLLSVGGIDDLVESPHVTALPETVATRWPGLIRGTVRGASGLILVLDPEVLVGVVEAGHTGPGGVR